jgi:hypothetical protein
MRGLTASSAAVLSAFAVASSGVGDATHSQSPGSGSGASSHVRASVTTRRIGVAALTVSLPEGWHWTVARGNYRTCTNPVGDLALASYRLPVGFGKREGPTVVPPNGILLELVSEPITSGARPWKRWQLSNSELRRARTVGPNHYASEVALPSSQAVTASAYVGSVPVPQSVLAAANRVLRSVRISHAYGCQ